MLTSRILEKKRKALDKFSQHLLSSPEGKNVGKIILFGSLIRGEAKTDSDVDVLVLALDNLPEVENAAADAAFEIGMEIGESVEPLVYCLDEWRYPISYFIYKIAQNGEEIYSMDEAQIRKEESRGYRDLALEYLEGASDSLKSGHPRLAVDAAYNAAELCAKGLLLLKMDKLPTSHGGVVVKFGEKYVKEGLVPRKLGREMNKTLALRNKSRYDCHAMIGSKEAEDVRKLAEEMIKILDNELG
ncbi:MAG: HEPN domain-containing protein [Desulfobacterales bacterium]|nr:MAG: HEPN domain-containing protein [Desulfobacterales bacterium]